MFNSENLKGLNVAFFGDSYFAGQAIGYKETYVGILGEKYGMNLYNFAIGGSTISNFVTTNTPLVDRWTHASYKDIINNLGDLDLIIIQGGRNDSTQNVPLGTGESADTATYLGAIRYMYEKLSAQYPNATIVFTTAWGVGAVNFKNELGLTTHDYATAMVNYCAKMGYYCIDMSDASKSGVDINDTIFRKKYSQTPGDYSHLNYFGQRLVYPYFERELDAILAKESGSDKTGTNNIIPVTWTNDTYIGGDTYGTKGVRAESSKYRTTELFIVPKAGTTIYFIDNCKSESKTNGNVNILTNYKYDAETDTATGLVTLCLYLIDSENREYLPPDVAIPETGKENIFK